MNYRNAVWGALALLIGFTRLAQAGAPLSTPAPADLEAFFDGLVPYALKQAGIPGGAVSIVKDGHIVFAKGYGYADLTARTPIMADTTLFRQGSLSKLFTATAVMQLVERGKLDLDANVNTYLDFQIPDTFEQPITLRHLLTHTAGFEEMTARYIYVSSADRLAPLGQHLGAHVPKRIFGPGERIAYSNYGFALAGYVVERASGEAFASYVRKHIFEPLGMSRSTFEQPLPGDMENLLAKSYAALSKPAALPFSYVQISPAGAMTATVTDMSRFAIAHLQLGQLGDSRILRAETATLMHARQQQSAPGRSGFAFGFWEAHRNGWRLIGHSGDVGSFRTSLYLVPEAGYGIVTQLNGTGEAGRRLGSDVVRGEILEAFLDRYLPGEVAQEPTASTSVADAARVAGRYQSTRRNESTRSLMAAVQADDEVSALPDGTIQVSSRSTASGALKVWREVGPLVYREVGGEAHLSFVTDPDGRIAYWISDDYPPAMVFERLHGLRGLGLLQPQWLIAFSAGGFLVLVWSAVYIIRRQRRRIRQTNTKGLATSQQGEPQTVHP